MVSNEYSSMAENLKKKFYIRDAALRYSVSSGSRTRRRRGHNYNYARPVTVKRKNPFALVSESKAEAEMRDKKTVKVKTRIINPLFVACIIVATFMLLSLVTCFAEVYQSTKTVGDLEKQLDQLKTEEAELAVRLDSKKDLKEIERYATTKLGMVSEDSIQKQFVSLSEGEHIDVMESTETNESTGGIMLSSILSSIGRFFDRFK